MKKVLTNLKDKFNATNKKLVATFAVLATFIGVASYAYFVNASDMPEHHKRVTPNGDGTYKISLDVTGDANTEKPQAKANILVVYDVSGSMNNSDSYIYAEKDTGRYGYVGNSRVNLYYQSGTDWWGDPTYSQINNDTTQGDVYYRYGGEYYKYTGKRYWHVKRSQAAEKVVYDFAEALFKNNKTATDDNIEMALLTFSSGSLNGGSGGGTKETATKLVQDWTNKGSEFLSNLSNKGNDTELDYGGGTNWEAAMAKALDVLADADKNKEVKDPTYVIFVTDGAPTMYINSSGSGNSTETDDYEKVYPWVRQIHERANTELYAIYAFGPSNEDYLDDVMYYANTGRKRNNVNGQTVATDNYYKAAEADELTKAIEEIFNKIAKTLGVGAVSIADGTTSNVKATTGSTSTNYNLLNVDESSYEYWLTMDAPDNVITRKNLVTGVDYPINVSYDGTGEVADVTLTWDDGNKSVTVQGYVKNGKLTYRWTSSNAFYELPKGDDNNPISVPTASLDKTTGAVNWDLAPVGTLLDGVTYTVTFDVWPSQYTYDLVSDIKNGLVDYEDDEQVDPEIKKYLKCNANKECTLLTNTFADLTYTDTDIPEGQTPKEQTIPFTDEIEPVATTASNMTVKKIWDNQLSGDTHGDNEYDKITFKVIKDNDKDNPYDTKELLKSNNWTDSIFIAPGLIQVKNGKAIIRELGHDYTFNENPEELKYHWDLQVETVRPMVINGVLTTLVKVTDNAPAVPTGIDPETGEARSNMLTQDGVTYYAIDGSVYFVRDENAALMTASNVRRSNLNITKEVIGEGPADSEFTFKLKVNDITGSNLWFSIYDPKTGTVKDDQYVSTAAENIISKENGEDGKFNGFYEVKSGSELTVKLKADWNLRFTNLPLGSTYEFEEIDYPANFVYDESDGTTALISVNLLPQNVTDNGNGTYTDKTTGTVYTKVTDSNNNVTYTYSANVTKTKGAKADKVSGTIYTGNTSYIVKYTNEYQLTNIKVVKSWIDNSNQDGKRPDKITIKLYKDGTLEKTQELTSANALVTVDPETGESVTDNNTWVYTFQELQKWASGREIKYTITEDEVAAYTTEFTSDLVSVDVIAKNVSENDTVTVELLANGEATGKTVTLNKKNNFKASITDLEYLDDNNELITYTTRITNNSNAVIKMFTNNKTISLSNTHNPEKITKISGTKTWADEGNTSIRPEEVIVTLTGTITVTENGEEVEKVVYGPANKTLNSNNSWKYEFTDLDRYKDGQEITYIVTESKVNGYDSNVNKGDLVDNGDGTYTRVDDITNTLITIDIPVTKNWIDESNHDGFRPDSIIIRLLANGTEIAHKELTSANALVTTDSETGASTTDNDTWTEAFTNLNKFDKDGNEITYTLTEDKVTNKNGVDYESSSACNTDDNGYTFYNELLPDKSVNVNGEKTWVDGGNTSIKPSEITITLTGTITKDGQTKTVYTSDPTTVTADSEGKWAYSFTGLYKYVEGEEITYKVNEITVPGYESKVEGNNIINTLITTEVEVTKNWVDESNHDGFRPDEIIVNLIANDNKENPVQSVRVTGTGDTWTHKFENLNKFDKNGNEITYTVTENEVVNKNNQKYEQKVECNNGSCTITNTLLPDKTVNVNGEKTWVDGGNTSIKPSEIKVTLTGTITKDGQTKTVYTSNPTTVKADSEGKWKYSFTGLYKYVEGEEINYKVNEITVPGYESKVEGNNIVNTLITTEVEVTKNWVDESNHDGFRPDEIIVNLIANDDKENPVQSVRVTGTGDTWTHKFENLNKFDKNGKEITYTVTENEVVNKNNQKYEQKVECNNGSCTITNTLLPDKTVNVNGEKTWVDGGNTSIKPSEITVTLTGTITKDGQTKTVYTSDPTTVKADSEGKWEYSFTGLYKYVEGEEITYKVNEITVPGYDSKVEGNNIVNTLITTEVEATKTWDDNNDQDGKRPEKIIIRLYADGKEIDHKEVTVADAIVTIDPTTGERVTDSNKWLVKFTNLNKLGSDGHTIVYTVSEDPVDEYTSSKTGNDFTNSHTPELIDIPVTKVWDDANNQDGKRPSSITVRLLADGVEVKNATISADQAGNWQTVFTDLPKYKDGEEIVYTVTEDAIDNLGTYTTGYGSQVDPETKVTIHIVTNKHIPLTTSVSGNKTWDDAGDQDGKRPTSITVRLLADGTEVKHTTVTPDEKGDWTYSFSDLPMYNNGTVITYTISEDAVEKYETGYTKTETGYNITNTYSPETTSVSGTKTWKDNNDQDGKRPESIIIRLLADGTEVKHTTVTPDEKGDWTYSFPGLPAYKEHGKKIVYTVTEDPVSGYTAKQDGYNFTNSYTPETTSVDVVKTWNDNGDQDGARPESITVRLLADGAEVKNATITPDESGNWQTSFADLPKFRDQGVEIVYTVTEDPIDGYTVAPSQRGNTHYLTNNHATSTTSVSGTKTWKDNDDQDGARPESITVRLLADGKEVKNATVTPDESGNWTYSFSDLPEFRDHGVAIVYTVTEDPVAGYTTKVDGFNITNSYTPETTSVSGTKTWSDNNDQDGARPESITVRLLADGTEIKQTTVKPDESGKWAYSFPGLPKFRDHGVEIVYTVTEDSVSGYTTEQAGYNFTNTYSPATTSVSGRKIWDDADDQDGKRPDSIKIRLLADGKEVVDADLTAENGWAYSFTGLPKFRDQGVTIVYTVTEDPVAGYTTKVEGFNITNSYTPETTSVSGAKTWDDNDDQDGARPESITVRLLADGKEVKNTTVSPDEEGNWTYSFIDLPKFRDHGVEIAYTVTEDEVSGYTAKVEGFNITNSHTPETTSVSGKKVWSDSDNLEGYRPDSITIRLLADGTEVAEKTLTKDNADKDGYWIYSFTDLPKYSEGEEISYTVTEDEVANYKTYSDPDNQYIIINEHVPSQTEVKVTKKWITESAEGIKDPYEHAKEIKVTLEGKVGSNVYCKESVILKDKLDGTEETGENALKVGENWTYTFQNLPEYREGKLITYTVTEDTEITEYNTAIESDDKNPNDITITNTYNPGKVTISGTKVWDDESDQDGARPDSIKIRLYADGVEVGEAKTVTADDEWKYTFDNLPKQHNKQDIKYTITEESVKGYVTEIEPITDDNKNVTGYTITNTHTPETVSYMIHKIWTDNGNNDGIRPDTITVRILADGIQVGEDVTISEANDWYYEFKDLPKYKAGKLITYSIEEDEVKGYTTSVPDLTKEQEVYNITNTHEDETIDIVITKTWDDTDDAAKLRPLEIVVDLKANGEVVETYTISEEDGWTKTIKGLPKFLNGEEIVYTIYEHEIAEYETTIEKTEDGFNIINHHELGKGNGPEEEPPQTGLEPKENFNILYIILILLSVLGINLEFLKY